MRLGSQEGIQQTARVRQLLLDPENPRLASGAEDNEPQDQLALVRRLWEEMSVDEVAQSIGENGYYPQERLLVVPAAEATRNNEPRFVVVEGNRRLAAVRLLLEDDLRQKIGATDLPPIGEDDS